MRFMFTNYITTKFAKRLQLRVRNIDLQITNMNCDINQRTTDQMQSRTSGFIPALVFLIANTITNLVYSQQLPWEYIYISKRIKLAEPGFHVPSGIDAL